MPTVKTAPTPRLGVQRRRAARKIAVLREEVDDLRDSLDLLDARTRDDGRRYSAEEVRAKLGLASRSGTLTPPPRPVRSRG
jgi:hypothetical protein